MTCSLLPESQDDNREKSERSTVAAEVPQSPATDMESISACWQNYSSRKECDSMNTENPVALKSCVSLRRAPIHVGRLTFARNQVRKRATPNTFCPPGSPHPSAWLKTHIPFNRSHLRSSSPPFLQMFESVDDGNSRCAARERCIVPFIRELT